MERENLVVEFRTNKRKAMIIFRYILTHIDVQQTGYLDKELLHVQCLRDVADVRNTASIFAEISCNFKVKKYVLGSKSQHRTF